MPIAAICLCWRIRDSEVALSSQRNGQKNTPAKDFWKHSYALASLEEARDALSLYAELEGQDERKRRLFLVAFVIAYMRPFTNNNGIGQISPKAIPKEFLSDGHEKIKKLRHTVIAHTDGVEKISEGSVGRQLNELILRKSADGDIYPSISTPYLPAKSVQVCQEMLERMITNLRNKVADNFNSLDDSHLNLNEGEYIFDYQKPKGEQWQKVD